MKSYIWNPWHGCIKYSEGCQNCYVYRRDNSIGKDASEITKNSTFSMPLDKNRKGEYIIPSGSLVYLCMTSDFFLDKADLWRPEIWDIIKKRSDVDFMIITKRIVRFSECVPNDWGEGYPNVFITCTVENQRQWNIRIPIFNTLSIAKKFIACEPLLSPIDMTEYLSSSIKNIIVGGESGPNARICDYNWVLDIRRQCMNKNVGFYFKQTGANFLKDGRLYHIQRKYQHSQAKKAGINTVMDMVI